MIFEAFFLSTTLSQPMEIDDVLTYVWLGQAFLALLPWNTSVDFRIMIRSGGVAYELLRPVDLYNYWFSRSMAERTAPTLLRAVPLLLFAGVFMGMRGPDSSLSLVAFLLAMCGAVLLSSALTTVFNITLLWTIAGDGMLGLVPAVVTILSGMLVPLPLFPEWAQTILNLLPFRGLVDTPYRLYLGHVPPSDLPMLLAHQLAWTLAIMLLGRWLLSRGLRRLVVQGG